MNIICFKWTDDSVTALRDGWAAGETMTELASLISERFGYVTRSAVAGKLKRVGLPRRRDNVLTKTTNIRTRSPELKTQDRAIRAHFGHVKRIIKSGKYAHRAVDVVTHWEDRETPHSPQSQPKTLLELSFRDCRWPIGDPGTRSFHFCGAPEANLAATRPYCLFHARIARRPK